MPQGSVDKFTGEGEDMALSIDLYAHAKNRHSQRLVMEVTLTGTDYHVIRINIKLSV